MGMTEREGLCLRVAEACRAELCGMYPALSKGLGMLAAVPGGEGFRSDGRTLFVPEGILAMYAENPGAVRRGWLHMVIHWLYLHPWGSGKGAPEDWDLACDIWTESLIDSLKEPRLESKNSTRERVLDWFGQERTPEGILHRMKDCPFSRDELSACAFDDHALWRKPEADAESWKNALPGGGDIGKGRRGSSAGGQEEAFSLLETDPRDYRAYLKKYTVPGEETELDDESFDYIYYDLGMRRYGNLPLMEPLEYKEVWRLDSIVIAIDTSGSCSRETVGKFLKETYDILASRESFFRKMNAVFFQCDCVIQDRAVIRSREEWLSYVTGLKIIGRGGTDFRPVFREIARMREAGEMKKPRALLYFTDGDGAYPTEAPDYETVFVLAGEETHPELVPKWAEQKILEQVMQ